MTGTYLLFEDNFTADEYLESLLDDLLSALTEIFLNELDNDIPVEDIWFQQDGAQVTFWCSGTSFA